MKTMTLLRSPIVIAFAVGAGCLAGCRVGPKYQRPPAIAQAPPAVYKESPQNFPGSDAWKVAQPQDAMLRGKWWEIFNDPELNALEDKVNLDNQNIKRAFENFMAARAIVSEARSQLFPTVAFNPSFQESGTSANNTTSTSRSSSTTTTTTTVLPTNRVSGLYSLPLDVSWEPDLFGRIRNTIREEQSAAQVSAADLENERLVEQASLAQFLFLIRGQDALLALLNETITHYQQTLEYTRAQYETGVGTQISVVEAQANLQSAQASATNVGIARAQYEHAIAVLVGANPSTFSISARPLNATPPAIPLGLPSGLLERRPDIAAAERTMAQANAAIGVADAAFYPTVTLGGTVGLSSSSLKHLFDWSSRVWSVGPSVSETIYDGGLRRATVRQFVATYNADVANYRQTVLTAFQQVEDYLASVRILSQEIQQQQQAVASAQQFVDLELARYQTGIDPYVNVLTAQNTLLADQQTLNNLRTQAMTSSVQLITALGGGWDTSQLPTPAQVSQTPPANQTVIQR
jgi:NodT family efflux transporter outer membrane factor (OMF) lipoprotein